MPLRVERDIHIICPFVIVMTPQTPSVTHYSHDFWNICEPLLPISCVSIEGLIYLFHLSKCSICEIQADFFLIRIKTITVTVF